MQLKALRKYLCYNLRCIPALVIGGLWMFVINERGPKPSNELIEMFKNVEPATVGHFKHQDLLIH